MVFKKSHILGIALLFVLVVGSQGKRITLVADRNLNVLSLQTDGKKIGTIYSGEFVEVLECKDLKHYIIPKVKLPNGNAGYVLEGEYHLIRRHVWQTINGGAISFSCS